MCTRLILSGQPISVIQRIMGDNTPDIIMKIYTHVNEEMAMKATESFYEELNRKNANRTAWSKRVVNRPPVIFLLTGDDKVSIIVTVFLFYMPSWQQIDAIANKQFALRGLWKVEFVEALVMR